MQINNITDARSMVCKNLKLILIKLTSMIIFSSKILKRKVYLMDVGYPYKVWLNIEYGVRDISDTYSYIK